MSESVRTLIYVGVAACVLLLAIFTRPSMVDPQAAEATQSKEFFPNLKDPLAATSLEIVTYDPDTAQPQTFKVAKTNNVWAIPSHENYPADADKQLGEAAASIMNLERGPIISDRAGDHETYGVVDPDPKTLKSGATGVGTRVTLDDQSNKHLAQLIIGKADKTDAEIRYVRVPGSDAVYRVKLDTSKLTTKFESWIEPDLLKLNAFEIQQVLINNYHVDPLTRTSKEGDNLELTYNDTDQKWSLKGLPEGEELATDKLNAMKTALDDLKIVDVHRKPPGLSQALRGEEAGLRQEDLESLAAHGFLLQRNGGLICTDGEVDVQMKDGVVYDLKFGGLASGTGSADDKPKEGDAAESKAAGANRYIFVMARLDENAIPKPELTPMPTEVQPAPAPPAEKPAGEKPAEGGGDLQPGEPEAAADPAAKATTGTGSATVSGAPDDPKEAERRRIERENKLKMDEYTEKVEKAKKRVDELNTRFSDWYYVIPDDVYQKIHLGRADIIKESKTPNTLDALEGLRQQGIDKPADPSETPMPGGLPGGLGGGLGTP